MPDEADCFSAARSGGEQVVTPGEYEQQVPALASGVPLRRPEGTWLVAIVKRAYETTDNRPVVVCRRAESLLGAIRFCRGSGHRVRRPCIALHAPRSTIPGNRELWLSRIVSEKHRIVYFLSDRVLRPIDHRVCVGSSATSARA